MRNAVRITAMGVIFGATLAACGGDDNGGGGGQTTTPTQPSTYGLEPFAQQQVIHSTCDTLIPATVTGVTFVYAADQDTADPRALSTVIPGCTQ